MKKPEEGEENSPESFAHEAHVSHPKDCPVDTPVVIDPLTHHARHLTNTEAHALEIAKAHPSMSEGTLAKLVAGGLSCMILSLALNPMDVIKVRLQTQNQLSTSSGKLYENQKYRGFAHAGKTILKEEGYFKGLMRGITPSMMREASYSSIRMGLYDFFKGILAPQGTTKEQFSLWQKMGAGVLSGGLGSAIASPTDLIKIRFQSFSPSNPNPYKNTLHAFSETVKRDGILGLWKGGGPTIARATILTSCQLTSYDHSKRVMIQSGHFMDNPFTHFLASFISGLVTTTCVNPADVIKTRIMTDGSSSKKLYKGPIDCLVQTIKREGARSLMKGWIPNYCRLGPHFIISLPLSEFIRTSLGADTM
eukprot:TRINITY_DN3087_c0_g1_i1.p1 TRINITY_DN3087_c0_g1~~TRINITY_DN3087_c0_g1_i1.p1  ORF type:complete len:364 (-),score=76.74 TRINITY_DN3087_c0_g1_i1:13-1104(-)